MRAIGRAPRKYAASPVYRMLLRIAGTFPAWMEARVAATARPHLAPATKVLTG